MTRKPEKLSSSSLKKTVQEPESGDTLPKKQMQTHEQPAYQNSKIKLREAEEAQQQ